VHSVTFQEVKSLGLETTEMEVKFLSKKAELIKQSTTRIVRGIFRRCQITRISDVYRLIGAFILKSTTDLLQT